MKYKSPISNLSGNMSNIMYPCWYQHNKIKISNMDPEYVCSVQKENKLGFYRIHSIWYTDRVRVNIASMDASWSGEVSRLKIEETSKNLSLPPDVYLEECKAALTTDEGLPGILYAVEDGSFVWKKVIDEELGIKVQLGAIPLEPISFVNTIQKMLDVALLSKQNFQNNLIQSTVDKNSAENNLNETFQMLEECKNKIKNMENDLMRNFVLILNAKKCRISELDQEITMLMASRPKKLSKKLVKQVDENPYDVDTDDDMQDAAVVGPIVGCLPNRSNTLSKQEFDCNIDPSNKEQPTLLIAKTTKDESELSKESSPETLPSKSSDILDFFFGALS